MHVRERACLFGAPERAVRRGYAPSHACGARAREARAREQRRKRRRRVRSAQRRGARPTLARASSDSLRALWIEGRGECGEALRACTRTHTQTHTSARTLRGTHGRSVRPTVRVRLPIPLVSLRSPPTGALSRCGGMQSTRAEYLCKPSNTVVFRFARREGAAVHHSALWQTLFAASRVKLRWR
eukprot:409201-Pleurochrysis_carterae.AAC.1